MFKKLTRNACQGNRAVIVGRRQGENITVARDHAFFMNFTCIN